VNSRPPLSDRTRARQAALQMLYQWEVGGGRDAAEVVRSFWMLAPGEAGDPEPGEGGRAEPAEFRAFAEDLLLGTIEALAKIDPLIAEHAEHWRLPRMAAVDRAILRLAVFQLLDRRDTPPGVVINEALELARLFSTEEAVGFVNGVLDAIYRSLRDEEAGRH
jgi:N utilization substance protein B